MKGWFLLPDNNNRILATPGEPAQTRSEFYTESFSEVLVKNIGSFVVCEFLIGNDGLVEKYGILFAAGNNFITLYDREYDNYTVCDFYALKFLTIYNSKVRPPYFVPRNQQQRPNGRMR